VAQPVHQSGKLAGALPHDGPAIGRQFPRLDVLFVGAGTAGTLMGGTRVPPPSLDASYMDDVVRIEEANTVRACHRLARHGLLFGGSTGTVVSGATSWLIRNSTRGVTAVAIGRGRGLVGCQAKGTERNPPK
jgi:N-(2-amino-2-carboxyethyl)-L-glutamate synthase